MDSRTIDNFYAEGLPLGFLSFIHRHGGLDKLYAEIWNELFCPEFLQKMAKGKLRAVVLNRAYKRRTKRMFDMAYEEGFIEKRGKLMYAILFHYNALMIL